MTGRSEDDGRRPDPDRRKFLRGAAAAAGAMVLSPLAACGCGAVLPASRFPAGPPEDYPEESLLQVSGTPVFVLHRAEGFAAISGKCTHWGCAVEREGRELICPCHGSRFRVDGTAFVGPAEQDLPWLAVEIEGGILMIDPNRTVPKGTYVRAEPLPAP
jgi:nitrite reductase/ring-hydroxylating ferredoxin subunit